MSEPVTIQVDLVGFNRDWVRRQSEKKFIEHPMHEHHYRHLKAEQKRELLKVVYKMCKK